MANELLEKRIEEALEKLEGLEVGSKEREALVKEIVELQQIQTAEYRAEVEAYDKQEQREIDKSELELKEAEIKAGEKRSWIEVAKLVAMTAVNVLMVSRVLKIEETGTVHTKATSMLPKGRFW